MTIFILNICSCAPVSNLAASLRRPLFSSYSELTLSPTQCISSLACKFYFEETCPSIAVVLSFSIIFFSLPILRMLSVLSKLVSILLLLLSVHVKVYKIHDNIFYNIYQAYFFLCMFNSQMEFHGGLLKLSCLSIEILQLILLDYTCAKPYYTHFS